MSINHISIYTNAKQPVQNQKPVFALLTPVAWQPVLKYVKLVSENSIVPLVKGIN